MLPALESYYPQSTPYLVLPLSYHPLPASRHLVRVSVYLCRRRTCGAWACGEALLGNRVGRGPLSSFLFVAPSGGVARQSRSWDTEP